MNDIGQELFQARNHKDSLNDLSVSITLQKVATCGDGCIKIHDLNDPKDIFSMVQLDDDRGQLSKLKWSEDGQFISIGTQTGIVHTFLAKLPNLYSTNGSYIMYLTSLLEVTITNQGSMNINKSHPTTTSPPHPGSGSSSQLEIYQKKIPQEPTILSLGTQHFALGILNKSLFYNTPILQPHNSKLIEKNSGIVLEKEYLSTVKGIYLNSKYAAVFLSDGSLIVHEIVQELGNEPFQKTFPDREFLRKNQPNNMNIIITCIKITQDFFNLWYE